MLVCAPTGSLCGNDKKFDDRTGSYVQGDRVRVLLDLGGGSLRFFTNGGQHGQGCAADSATGPVVGAAQMCYGTTARGYCQALSSHSTPFSRRNGSSGSSSSSSGASREQEAGALLAPLSLSVFCPGGPWFPWRY
jgi:hypothetical protein